MILNTFTSSPVYNFERCSSLTLTSSSILKRGINSLFMEFPHTSSCPKHVTEAEDDIVVPYSVKNSFLVQFLFRVRGPRYFRMARIWFGCVNGVVQAILCVGGLKIITQINGRALTLGIGVRELSLVDFISRPIYVSRSPDFSSSRTI